MTAAAVRSSEVVVLDLRDWRDQPLPVVSGYVVVLDSADSLLDHHDIYFALVDDTQVYGLICVAVGQSRNDGSGDGVVLQVPRVLLHGAGIVLWVGDDHGVYWGETEDRPRPAEAALPSGLDRLVETLRVSEVFEQVRAAAARFPGRTASPGLALVSGAVEGGELSQARATAVARLTDVRTGAAPPPALQDPANFAADLNPPAAVLESDRPVGERLTRARDAVNDAETSANAMRGWGGLFGQNRSGDRLGGEVVIAAHEAERYRVVLAALLGQMDGQLRVRQPPVESVVAMGVRPPTPAQPENIAAKVQDLVRTTLARQPSLSTLAGQLRQAAARAAPQGCTEAWKKMEQREPIRREVPAFRRWPLSLWMLPLVLLTCFMVSFVPAVTWVRYVVGAVFVLAWFLSGWFLLARRPGLDGEYGGRESFPSAFLTYGLTGLVGAAAGIVLAGWVQAGLSSFVLVPTQYAVAAITVAALLLVVAVALSWPTAVRRWTAALGLPELRDDVVEMTAEATDVVAAEWLPAERRRAVAEAFAEVAVGLEEISSTLRTDADDLFGDIDSPADGPGGLMRPVPQELLAVVGTDLLDLAHESLRQAWPAIVSGRRNMEGIYTQSAARRLGEYRTHVAREGFLTVPRFVSDSGPRDRLVARQWSESPDAVAALRSRLSDTMTQLCQARQLTSLDREAGGRLLRFAPKPVQRVLEADRARNQAILAEPTIWTAAGELAGVLRLLPLRLGSVREQHAGGAS